MGCQVYYYSGAYDPKLKRELNIDQLFSVYHEKRLIIDTIKYKQEHPEYTARIMCDSGAFSQYMNLKKKGHIMTDEEIYAYTDDYIVFLNEWGKYLTCFVAVDSVPDPENVDPTYAQKTWDNYLYMWERLNPDIRDKLIPVFHYKEDWKWLRNMLEYRHPDGSKVEYLGLAISLEGTKKVRINWGQDAMKIIADSSNPNVKTHAFGVGVKSVLEHIDVYSTDATSYLKRAAYGMISIDDRTIYISDVQKEALKGNHYSEKSTAYQESIENIIKERGFTVDPYELEYTIIDDNHAKFDFQGNNYNICFEDKTKLSLSFNDKIEIMKLSSEIDNSDNNFNGLWESKRISIEFQDNILKFDPGTCLSTNCYARAIFNILDTENWMKEMKASTLSKIKTKVDLW